MNILKIINKKINERATRDAMARYYRTEFGKEWNQCSKMFPTLTDSQIAASCFEPRFK